MIKKIGFGIILWAIPYATAIPLLGLMQSDVHVFKTIMILVGTLVGCVLAAVYFLRVERDFLREGIVLGVVWIVVSWALDFIALLPFSGHTVPRYFLEIGLRYLATAAPTIAIGYVLDRRSATLR